MKYLAILLFTTFLFSQEQGWETDLAPVPGQARNHPITFSIDGQGYLLTGFVQAQSSVLNDFYKYDPTTDNWTELDPFPGTARGFSYGDVYNGKAYVGFGLGIQGNAGLYLNDLWEFDPETEEWTRLEDCPCDGRRHPAFLITDNGKLFVGLGDNNINGNLNDWWEYDIENSQWSQRENLPSYPRHHPYFFSIGDDAYVGLGHGSLPDYRGFNIYDEWFKWDTEDNSWTELSSFPWGGKVAGTQFDHNGKGYVLSGQVDQNEYGQGHANTEEGLFYQYIPDLDLWLEMPSHPGESRWAPGSFVSENWVYFMSGQFQLGLNPGQGQDLNTMMRYPLEPVATVDYNQINIIYPNPVVNNLSIDLNSEVETIYVYNSLGRIVHREESNIKDLNLGFLNPGSYIIEIRTNKENYINKFIKSDK